MVRVIRTAGLGFNCRDFIDADLDGIAYPESDRPMDGESTSAENVELPVEPLDGPLAEEIEYL